MKLSSLTSDDSQSLIEEAGVAIFGFCPDDNLLTLFGNLFCLLYDVMVHLNISSPLYFPVDERHCFVSIPPAFAERLLHGLDEAKTPVILKIVVQHRQHDDDDDDDDEVEHDGNDDTSRQQMLSHENGNGSLTPTTTTPTVQTSYVSWGGGTSGAADELNVRNECLC